MMMSPPGGRPYLDSTPSGRRTMSWRRPPASDRRTVVESCHAARLTPGCPLGSSRRQSLTPPSSGAAQVCRKVDPPSGRWPCRAAGGATRARFVCASMLSCAPARGEPYANRARAGRGGPGACANRACNRRAALLHPAGGRMMMSPPGGRAISDSTPSGRRTMSRRGPPGVGFCLAAPSRCWAGRAGTPGRAGPASGLVGRLGLRRAAPRGRAAVSRSRPPRPALRKVAERLTFRVGRTPCGVAGGATRARFVLCLAAFVRAGKGRTVRESRTNGPGRTWCVRESRMQPSSGAVLSGRRPDDDEPARRAGHF
jgi:hypothetical protein